ncbi:hypothetical protein JEQ12_019809 [Ovis aries]|uniref:Katanin p80 subunit C-terminal domain-containing protein n=1 Tax=Ovis aries TaxID=9940 RepID=A0A836CQ54_SHEEP|nr:hypothetical protein JEQ12_019809 [Ovis aries]
MASETHNVKKRNFCNNTEDHPTDLPRKRTSNFTNKNMKEVKKSPKQLAVYIARTVEQAVKSPDKLCKVYRRKKVHHPIQNPCYRKKQPPTSRGCVMANKENELACAGHLLEKLRDSGSSQTESSSSKYSGFFSEQQFEIDVALTFWRKRTISELVACLIGNEDLGVVVDCLPVLTKSLQEEKQYISLGCCVDVLPLGKLQAVIKRWWSELSSKTEIQLSGLWEQENHLTLVPGYTGNIAKDCFQLHLHH